MKLWYAGGRSFSPMSVGVPSEWFELANSGTLTYSTPPAVIEWADMRGNGVKMTTGGVSNRPDYITDTDGYPALQFGGSRYLMSNQVHSAVRKETLFVVVKVNAISATNKPIVGNNAAVSNWNLYHSYSGSLASLEWTTVNSTAYTQALRVMPDKNIGNWKILAAVRDMDSGVIALYENGELVDRDTHSDGQCDVQMVLNYNRFGWLHNINVRALIRYPVALQEGDILRMNDYLNARYHCYQPREWAANDFPQFRRWLYANNITSEGSISSEGLFVEMLGDSYCAGYALKTVLSATYKKLFTNAYVYKVSAGAYSTRVWEALDTRDPGNNLGGVYATDTAYHGVEPVLCKLLADDYGGNVYLLKYGVVGAQLAAGENEWNSVVNGTTWRNFKRWRREALDKKIIVDGVRLRHAGLVYCLGTNDSASSADAAAYGTNEAAFYRDYRKLQGNSGNTRIVTVTNYSTATGTYPYLATVKVAKQAAAMDAGQVLFVDNPNDAGDLVDATHPDTECYEEIATTAAGYLW